MVLDFYNKILKVLQSESRLILMVVIANEGSSPGRKGFRMLVSEKQMHGTIGGGIMEHKLVEYSRSLLAKPKFLPFIKHQIHDKAAATDQSGMICSGQQTIAFYDVGLDDLASVESITEGREKTVFYTDQGITTQLNDTKPYAWKFHETTSPPQRVYIIGGGHVGLALSEVLSRLDFEIHILDHRENLNTMMANNFAHYRETVEFEKIENHIPEGNDVYVVIMSFGYRTDEIIVRRLTGRDFKYIGLMGSKEKITTLFSNLIEDGFDKNQLDKIQAPIGLDIKSETTQEIAISVAAQLISVKNKS